MKEFQNADSILALKVQKHKGKIIPGWSNIDSITDSKHFGRLALLDNKHVRQ